MEECIFCKIVRGEIPSHKVYEDEKTIAFQDINPVSDGHTLVVPKQHAENLYEIDPNDLTSVHKASQRIIRAIRKALDPIGVVVLQLNGRGVNQIIMHYHVHLIPRGEDDPPIPASDCGAKEGDEQRLKTTAEKIRRALEAG